MDRLTSMSVFVKAVELGSFSAAAEALETSSQLVGKQVQMLEQHLSVRLLNRTTRRQSLTEAGRAFYERAKSILAEMEAAEAMIADARVEPKGRLKINAPVSFGIHALTPRLKDYLNAHPQVTVDLSLSNRYVDVIEEGFDLVFRVGELSDSGLIARPLAAYHLVLCAAPAYLAAHPPICEPMDLTRHECLRFLHGPQHTHWTFDGPQGRVSVPVSGRLLVDNGEALLAAAMAGLGLMLQPLELARTALAAGTLVELLPEYRVAARPMHMLYAPDRLITPKLRSFIDFAMAVFGEERGR